MKKLLGILCGLVFILIGSTAFAAAEVSVEFNCMDVEFDQPAIISENRTLVPLRKIFELLGAKVEWDEETRTAVSEKNGRRVSVTIGSNILYVNDDIVQLDVPAKIVNNRTLVPLRAISEAYECRVEWNGEERLAEIFDIEFINSAKNTYEKSDGLKFEYFADCALTENGENAVSLKSGACSMTVSVENAANAVIDDEYLENIKKGLQNFSTLDIKYVKKISGKNAVMIKCYNKGNTIYYVFLSAAEKAYNLALTVPDGAQRYDAEKLMYVIKSFVSLY